MSTKDIEAMGKVWETEASNKFSKEKISKREKAFAQQRKSGYLLHISRSSGYSDRTTTY